MALSAVTTTFLFLIWVCNATAARGISLIPTVPCQCAPRDMCLEIGLVDMRAPDPVLCPKHKVCCKRLKEKKCETEPVHENKMDDRAKEVLNLDDGFEGTGEQNNTWPCGKATPYLSLDEKFGKPGQYSEMPWDVLIKANDDSNCAAVLISSRFALAAAHCVQRFVDEKLFVLPLDISFQENLVILVKKFIIHPEYQNVGLQNDIAVIVLEEEVQPSPIVGTICSFEPEEQITGLCFTFGHAKNSSTAKIDMRLEKLLTCNDKLRHTDLGPQFNLSTHSLCATVINENADVVKDFGVSLVCKSAKGDHFVLVGISSWGKQSNYPNAPDVFTSVRKYSEWIKQEAANLE